jgi:hypothetical protein
MIVHELAMARSDHLTLTPLAQRQFFGTDFTKPLLFIADGGYYANLADKANLTGDQWGVMNETGNYPGQPWLWLYQMWYHISPFQNSGSVDIWAVYLTGIGTILLLLVPFIPGLRDIPRAIPVYRLIWRSWYRSSGKPADPERPAETSQPAPRVTGLPRWCRPQGQCRARPIKCRACAGPAACQLGPDSDDSAGGPASGAQPHSFAGVFLQFRRYRPRDHRVPQSSRSINSGSTGAEPATLACDHVDAELHHYLRTGRPSALVRPGTPQHQPLACRSISAPNVRSALATMASVPSGCWHAPRPWPTCPIQRRSATRSGPRPEASRSS